MAVFRSATETELAEICALYRAASRSPFSLWNEYYPHWEIAQDDLIHGGLYVLTEEDTVIGALSLVPENELEDFSCWQETTSAREIARVAVAPSHQGQGLAKVMVDAIEGILKDQGCAAIHLSAAIGNLPAWKTYQKAGFSIAGEASLYGGQYYLMEKLLSP